MTIRARWLTRTGADGASAASAAAQCQSLDGLNRVSIERGIMENPVSKCPDCESPLQPIKLIDATQKMGDQEGRQHVELSYAALDATPSFFTGKVSRLGVVRGCICPSCGRILLYGKTTA